jgi:hypothetical protein
MIIWCLSFFSSISFTLIPSIIPHVLRCAIYHVRNMIESTSKSSAPWKKASCQLIGPSFKQFAKGTHIYDTKFNTQFHILPYFVLTMQLFGVEDPMHHFIQTSLITCHVSRTNPCTRTSYTSKWQCGFFFNDINPHNNRSFVMKLLAFILF